MGSIDINKLTKYGLIIIILILSIFLVKECNKPPITQPNVVEQLNKNKQEIDNKVDSIITINNNKNKNRIQNVKNKNKKNDENIKRIPSTDYWERDSIWSILLNSKDSLPTRYWDILEQRARRKSN